MLAWPPGDEVVEHDDLVTPVEQRLAQVRAEEAGAAGDHDPGHQAATDALVHEAAAAERLTVEQVAAVDDREAHASARPPCRSRAT